MQEGKFCNGCSETKPLTAFSKDKSRDDGLEYYCKVCKAEYRKEYRRSNKEKIALRAKIYREKNKEKERETGRLYRENNHEKIRTKKLEAYRKKLEQERARSNRYRAANREKILAYKEQYYLKNREKELLRRKTYCQNNREVISAYSSKTRAEKLKAIPPWANLEEIKKFYKEAKILTKSTGQKHHVDHIIPLRGKEVSGLHVENNLRVIPSIENMVKSNKLIEDLIYE